jgi:hypothetical protein
MPLRLYHFGTLLKLSRFAKKRDWCLPSPVGGWFLRLRLLFTIETAASKTDSSGCAEPFILARRYRTRERDLRDATESGICTIASVALSNEPTRVTGEAAC